jgi:phage gp29-like protein
MPDDGRPPQLPPVPSGRQFLELPITSQQVWESYAHVASVLEDLATAGRYQGAALLADACFTDDRMVAVLNTRINGVFALPMEFKTQGEGEDESEAPDPPKVAELKAMVAKVVEDNWETIMPAAVGREMLRWSIMLNLGIGELVWQWKGDLLLPTVKTWNPMFAYWRWDTRSDWLIHSGGQVELNPGDSRWVVLKIAGHNHGQLYGLIRAMGWLYLDRVFTFRNWSRAIEKYSLGVTKAFMPSAASDDDKERFQAAIANMPHEATVSLPDLGEDGKFDLEMMKTDEAVNWQSYVERVKQLDTSIAVVVLGQNLTTEVSAQTGGSRAAAKVHDEIRQDILKADVEVLSSVIKTQILTPFVFYNFAHDAEKLGIPWDSLVPDVTWNVEPPDDKQQNANALSAIATAVSAFFTAQAPVDYAALLERFDIPIQEKFKRPTKPPPNMVWERPRLPFLEPTDLPDPDYRENNYADPPPSAWSKFSRMSEKEAIDYLRVLAAGAERRPAKMPKAARLGQLTIDDLIDKVTPQASKAMEKENRTLLALVLKADSYPAMREAVQKHFKGSKPAKLRELLAKAIGIAQELGTLSAQ